MRTSTVTYNEALAEVNQRAGWLKEDGINTYVEERSADCSAFPCPNELGTWSGETNAIYLYNEETNEEVFACAYWE